MLILLGGLPGSGRKELSRYLSRKKDIHYLDIDQWKIRSPRINRSGEYVINPPIYDSDSMHVYSRVIADLPLLSTMHGHMIADDTFHRDAPRAHFIEHARSCCTDVIFIWIDTDAGLPGRRFVGLHRQGIVRSIRYMKRLRRVLEANTQEPPASVPRFHYTATTDEDVQKQAETLWILIQETCTRRL